MRVLFYLPVITPWWFDEIIEPLIRCLAKAAEIHILAPAPWQGTGIGHRELARCTDLPQLCWHIVEDENHPTLRTEPRNRADLIEFVKSLAPDYVLCRSADCETVRGFPGVVRHIMEGGAPPLAIPQDWIIFQEEPFDHGLLPDLDANARTELDRLIAPTWSLLHQLAHPTDQMRRSFRKWARLPAGRAVLALPLEYEHEENFYPMHRLGPTPNHRLVAERAARIDDAFFLAITNHPLNEVHIDNSLVEAEIASHRARMRLVPGKGPRGDNTTMLLARDADGILVGDSKVYSLAGFFGTPMLRRSRFKTGDWLNTYIELDEFLGDVAAGTARRPDQETARTWFAFHIANNLLDPNDPALTASDVLARFDRPVDPARWTHGFAHFDVMTAGLGQ